MGLIMAECRCVPPGSVRYSKNYVANMSRDLGFLFVFVQNCDVECSEMRQAISIDPKPVSDRTACSDRSVMRLV